MHDCPSLLFQDGTVVWHDSIKDVPRGRMTFYVAHEFFDALPLHQFQVFELNCNVLLFLSKHLFLFSLQIMVGEKYLLISTNLKNRRC